MLTNTMLLDTDTVQLLLHVQYMEEDKGHMEKRAKMKKVSILKNFICFGLILFQFEGK